MKKLISLVLAFVLIFSLGTSAFAYETAEYYLEHIWDRFADSSYHILDIRDDTVSILEFVENISIKVDIMEDRTDNFYRSFFGDVVWGEPFGEVVQDSLNQIVDVLANPEDEQLKEDTQENKESIISNFFSPSSSNSLKSDDIGEFSGFVSDFHSVFDTSTLVSVSPFEIFKSDSEALLWFTDATALAIDPNYSGGGGGSTPDNPDNPDPDNPDPDNPDPDNPDPDNPDPDNPDPDNPAPDNPDPDNPDPDNPDPDNPDPDNPDPDNPEPDPEPEPDPIINQVSISTTEIGGSSIYNGIGYANDKGFYKSGSTLKETDRAGYCLIGYINLPDLQAHTVYIVGYNFQSYSYVFRWPSASSKYQVDVPSPDANGVITIAMPKNTKAFRVSSYGLGCNLIVTIDEYPIKTTSTFNLRRPSADPEVVTNFYGARNYLWNLIMGGGK